MDTRYGIDRNGQVAQTSGGKSDDVDIGFAKPFGGMVVPQGYLYCDGSEVSRQAYDKLFAAIGTTWGEGDGVETFNIPDLRGIFVRCDGGENNAPIGERQGDAIRNISGSWSIRRIGSAVDTLNVDGDLYTTSNAGTTSCLASSSANAAHQRVTFDASHIVPTAPENRPINVAMKYCIRYE